MGTAAPTQPSPVPTALTSPGLPGTTLAGRDSAAVAGRGEAGPGAATVGHRPAGPPGRNLPSAAISARRLHSPACGVGAEAAGAAARDGAERLCNEYGNQNVVFAQLGCVERRNVVLRYACGDKEA